MKELVTRDSIAHMLENPNKTYVINVIGRALVAIFNRQTEDEKTVNDTRVWNSVGFSGFGFLSLVDFSFLKYLIIRYKQFLYVCQ